MRAFLLLALVACAAGGAVKLNEDNFAAEVTDSGPSNFHSNHMVSTATRSPRAARRRRPAFATAANMPLPPTIAGKNAFVKFLAPW